MRTRASAVIAAVLLGGSATAVGAQTLPLEPSTRAAAQAESASDKISRTTRTGTGEVGQRQTAREAAAIISPLGRTGNRLETRVENRLRNRIDRNYDPKANAKEPFERAAAQSRKKPDGR